MIAASDTASGSSSIRIDGFELRPDSGGAGRHRGGLGLTKSYTTLAPLTVSTGFERSRCAPWGVAGGGDAEPSRVIIERSGAAPEIVLKDERPVAAGDRVIVETGGGGGFGPVAERGIDAVIADVRNGYVSRAAAKKTYGVDLDRDGNVVRIMTASGPNGDPARQKGAQ